MNVSLIGIKFFGIPQKFIPLCPPQLPEGLPIHTSMTIGSIMGFRLVRL